MNCSKEIPGGGRIVTVYAPLSNSIVIPAKTGRCSVFAVFLSPKTAARFFLKEGILFAVLHILVEVLCGARNGAESSRKEETI